MKYKPLPKGVPSAEMLWLIVKFLRKGQQINTVVTTETGEVFAWVKLPELEEFFHKLDLHTGGHLKLFDSDIDEHKRQQFIVSGIMEEAIASSQLEGANTTRKLAKEFLRAGRKPLNKAEQMILNNYEMMKAIDGEYKSQKLTKDMLLEMHRMITNNTIDAQDVGCFRKDEDGIIVGDAYNKIYHVPPKMKFVQQELDKFIDFANDDLKENVFYHPIIKATIIHFWIGYLHPFVDGNGRLARDLFYWYLLRKGYWAFAYLPISTIIKKSPEQYKMAFVYSEQDDRDMTYFIDYSVRKIKLALGGFEEYVKNKEAENRALNDVIRNSYSLNERQIKLLQYYYKNPKGKTFPKMHSNIYQVSKLTALKDLNGLESQGFVVAKKEGRNTFYYPTLKIKDIIKN
ncbi:MAG: Fic family protein [Candidatus Moranbacteria bacterium]|nr:Fic family protein [Candidatus Moranbacteria bacterium]